MPPDQEVIPPAPDGAEAPVIAAHPHAPWARAGMWVGIVLIIVCGVVVLFRSCMAWPERMVQKTGDAVQKAGDAMATLASAYRRGTVTTSFVSYATTLTNSQRFQFATLKQMEIFTRTEEPSTAFGYVPLPDVIVEARAPVEYTYYLDLNAKWQFELRDGVLYVMAPPIRANHPAVDVSALSYEIKKGRFKSADAVENLQKSITSLVILRAKENIPLVRETGRRETTEFVEKWLERSFTDGKNYPVKVLFTGESPPDRVKVNTPPKP